MATLQNRFHTNGHLRSANETTSSAPLPGIKPTTSTRDVEAVIREYPGSVLLAGLITGGVIGWLTLKLSR